MSRDLELWRQSSGYVLAQDKETKDFVVFWNYKVSSGRVSYSDEKSFNNPLEAYRVYQDALNVKSDENFKKQLEVKGYDVLTGEREKLWQE